MKKMKDRTKENRQLLLDNLAEWHAPHEKKEAKHGLAPRDHHFLEWWKKNQSFTAHHATAHFEEIKKANALLSINQRQLAGESVKNSHTKYLARQKYIYFSLGRDRQLFTCDYSTEIILPLRCFNPKDSRYAKWIEKIWMGNHASWCVSNERTDPIEINGVKRYIRFDKHNNTKSYVYQKSSGETWSRIVYSHEEIFCSGNDAMFLIEILGLQFLLELRQFGGELMERILNHPEENQALISDLFQQLFPSEIYPELWVEGTVPLNLPGISILTSDKEKKEEADLYHAIKSNDIEKIKKALSQGAYINAPKRIISQEANQNKVVTPLIYALNNEAYRAAFFLIAKGARTQCISLNYPDNVLSVLLNQYHQSKHQSLLIDFIFACLRGLASDVYPQIKQHFDLMHYDNQLNSMLIVQLLFIAIPDPKDPLELSQKKSALFEWLKRQVKSFDDVGLILMVCIAASFEESFSEEKLKLLLSMLHEQGCDINRAVIGDDGEKFNLVKPLTNYGQLKFLQYVCDKPYHAIIYKPSHPLSPFDAAISTANLEIFNYLLTQCPLSTFSDEDHRAIILSIKRAKDSLGIGDKDSDDKDYGDEDQQIMACLMANFKSEAEDNLKLNKIKAIKTLETLFTADEKRRDLFLKTPFYRKSDHAVGGVIIVTVNNEKFTLLVGKSRSYQFGHKIAYYCGPGGIVDKNDGNFLQALIRETREETGFSIDPQDAKIQSIALYQREKDNFHRELFFIEMELDHLPHVLAKDDVLEVEWVPLSSLSSGSYRDKPVLKSNFLMMMNEKPDAVKRALYCENSLGQAEFEMLVRNNNIEAVKKMLDEGVDVLQTNAIAIAAKNKSKKMIEVLLNSLFMINQINKEGRSPLRDIYFYSHDHEWVLQLIKQYGCDWRTCARPEHSLANVIFETTKNYGFLTALILRKNALENSLYHYLFEKCVKNNQLYLVDLLIFYYPIQAKKYLKSEEVFLVAADASIEMFQQLLGHWNEKISDALIKAIQDKLEEAVLEAPIDYASSCPIMKESEIKAVHSSDKEAKSIAEEDDDLLDISGFPLTDEPVYLSHVMTLETRRYKGILSLLEAYTKNSSTRQSVASVSEISDSSRKNHTLQADNLIKFGVLKKYSPFALKASSRDHQVVDVSLSVRKGW
jgi:8-oxo-dGTP pyrophosphatase MutT (NUDIX family)